MKSPKSYNSQVGVPLSLAQMRPWHTLGIFEAGISQPGEMEALAAMIQPTYGIFTTLGTAHDEGFDSREQKLAEKLKLFGSAKAVVYCADDPLIKEAMESRLEPEQRWAWSWQDAAEIQVRHNNGQLTIAQAGDTATFQVPFQDPVSLENLTQALVLLTQLGVVPKVLQPGLSLLRPPGMRLSLKDGIHNCRLIDDTYNNDLAGLEVALHFMDRQPQRGGKTVILSDMSETGRSAQGQMTSIEAALAAQGVQRWIGVGPAHADYQPAAGLDYVAYASTEELLAALPRLVFQEELILIKGGRSFAFEQIVQALQQKVHGTVLEVNLEALTHNLNVYRSRLQPETKLMVMVKALAYGSGSEEIAHLLQFHRVDYLAVAYADEGVYLRERGITLPIMVMNPSRDSFAKLHQQ
ncbi:MAG TPA: bifunctional UDP-N-acetylmuramoyl-tripeptide:D-alanyl-D-alanine ligase/alanine racemase, partial [Cytophagales bacterium]|nr:bifunctional UDP-N-acetylmuramoyl-tripeptide:D-alanyl-D-alanine ligase/alanine racemase [Cytophagales bacterium]